MNLLFLLNVFLCIFTGQSRFEDDLSQGSNYVEITISQDSGTSWIVDLVIPSDNLGSLELREMRYTHENCEPIEYTLIDYRGVLFESERSTEARMYFTPIHEEPINISYLVSAPLYTGTHSIDSMSGCSSLLNFGEHSLLDGRALFLALRPMSIENIPYRFGETKFIYKSDFEELSYLSTGEYEGNNTWIIDRADDLRFSFLAGGNWEAVLSDNEDSPIYNLIYTDYLPYRILELNGLIDNIFKAFEERWGNAEIESYSVLLSPPTPDAGSFGQYSGIANPQSAAIHQGMGLNKRHLMTLIVHEIAHHWMPRRLGTVQEDTWIGEGLVELATYIELVRLGYAEEEFLLSRINRSISNLQNNYEALQIEYDLGIISWIIATEYTNSDLLDDRFDNLIERLEAESEIILTADRFWNQLDLQITEFNYIDTDILLSQLPCRLTVNGNEYYLIEHTWPTFERGFVLSDSVAGLIDTIISGSSAERAGLRAGDKIELIDSYGFGDIHNSIVIYYNRNGDSNSVAYTPTGVSGSVVYPQYISSMQVNFYNESDQCTDS